MNTVNNSSISVSVLTGGILGWLLGGFDSLIYALIVFLSIDYLTGVWLAVLEKKISSDIGFKGISKKVMIFILIAVGNVIDKLIIGSSNALRGMLIMFYISNEGISIIENIGRIGLPLPQKLRETIKKLNNTQ